MNKVRSKASVCTKHYTLSNKSVKSAKIVK